jgi:hypothetical protein
MTKQDWPTDDYIEIQACTGKYDTDDDKESLWVPQGKVSVPPLSNVWLKIEIMQLGSTQWLFPDTQDGDYRYGFKGDLEQFPEVTLSSDRLSICVKDLNNDNEKYHYTLKLVGADSRSTAVLVSRRAGKDPIYEDPTIQNRTY